MNPYSTFRAVVNIPKAQLKQDVPDRERRITVGGKAITMAKPQYETEAAVTTAVALGICKNSHQAYQLARDWQKQLKDAEVKTFRVPKAKPRANSSYTVSRYCF